MILGGDVLNQKKAKLKCAFTIKAGNFPTEVEFKKNK